MTTDIAYLDRLATDPTGAPGLRDTAGQRPRTLHAAALDSGDGGATCRTGYAARNDVDSRGTCHTRAARALESYRATCRTRVTA